MFSVKKALVIGLLLVLPLTAYAKRTAPKPVKPVVYGKYEYRAEHQSAGTVEIWDTETGKRIKSVRIYKVRKNPLLEGDVQDVFITGLELLKDEGLLLITNEKGEQYTLDPVTDKVKKRL